SGRFSKEATSTCFWWICGITSLRRSGLMPPTRIAMRGTARPSSMWRGLASSHPTAPYSNTHRRSGGSSLVRSRLDPSHTGCGSLEPYLFSGGRERPPVPHAMTALRLLCLLSRQFHHLRTSEEPIHAHI